MGHRDTDRWERRVGFFRIINYLPGIAPEQQLWGGAIVLVEAIRELGSEPWAGSTLAAPVPDTGSSVRWPMVLHD